MAIGIHRRTGRVIRGVGLRFEVMGYWRRIALTPGSEIISLYLHCSDTAEEYLEYLLVSSIKISALLFLGSFEYQTSNGGMCRVTQQGNDRYQPSKLVFLEQVNHASGRQHQIFVSTTPYWAQYSEDTETGMVTAGRASELICLAFNMPCHRLVLRFPSLTQVLE